MTGLSTDDAELLVGAAATGRSSSAAVSTMSWPRRRPTAWCRSPVPRRPPSWCSARSRRSRWHELLHGSFAGTGDPRCRRHRRARDRRPGRSDAAAPRQHPPDDGDAVAAADAGMAADGRRAAAAHCASPSPFREFDRADDGAAAVPDGRAGHRRDRRALVAAVAAVVASLLVNWFFVVPFHTLTIAEPENIVSLVRLRRRRDHGWIAGRHCAARRAARRNGPASRPRRWPDRRRRWPPTPKRCHGLSSRSAPRSSWIACVSIPTAAQLQATTRRPVRCVDQPAARFRSATRWTTDGGHRLELYGRSTVRRRPAGAARPRRSTRGRHRTLATRP